MTRPKRIQSEKTDQNTAFETSYNLLNAAQKRAVDAIEGPVMVIAGPGTGKTTILTLRIANILRNTDTTPDLVLALTFTESGAYAMRRKLVEIIGSAAYKVNIHTFHGFAEKIIGEYPDYFPRIIGSSIVTDAEQFKLIEKIIEKGDFELLRPYGDPLYYVRPVLHEIHLLKRENISPLKFLAQVKIEEKALKNNALEISKTELEKAEKRNKKNGELALVYEAYEEELAKNKYYDFDDLLLELIRAMNDEETSFKLILQEKYQYILADEHQDANASQNRILELLSDFHDSPNLFIVGDDKQAIYRFQGASLDNFLYFSKKYNKALVIALEHNYRSHQLILDASHNLILNNPKNQSIPPTRLISLQIGGRPIQVSELNSEQDEIDYIVRTITKLIADKEKPEEIAVLYRENGHAHDLSQALKEVGVAHRIESDHNILDEIDVRKIIILCKAIFNPADDESLSEALLLPEMKCDGANVTALFDRARKEKESLHVIIKNLQADKRSNAKGQVLGDVVQAYKKIEMWLKEAQTLPFNDFVHKLIQETSLVAGIMAAPNSLERISVLDLFLNQIKTVAKAKRTFYLKDFIEYIGIIHDHGLVAKRQYVEHLKGVRLMTAHRAKGLEFNYVFIVHAIDGIWGNRHSRSLFHIPIIEHARDTGRLEDERRLFYVALTRARESVYITSSKKFDNKQAMPSQFIQEIGSDLIGEQHPIESDPSMTDKIFKPVDLNKTKALNVSILDPGFIQAKFFSQPLSVTHLNNYLECPWKYFLVNMIRLPQAQSKHQMYGTAIHLTLRAFFDAYREEKTMNAKQVIELFKYNLEKEPLAKNDRDDCFEKGKNALSGYLKTYDALWNRNLLTEYSLRGATIPIDLKGIKGKIEAKNLELTGKLDKIELLNDHEVNVVDYKTSKPKSRNEIEGKTSGADGNYKRQLVFYKMLLDADRKYQMKTGEIDFVEPNERGKYKKEVFAIDTKETSALKEQIIKMAKDIADQTFVDKKCANKDCEYCLLGRILRSGGRS